MEEDITCEEDVYEIFSCYLSGEENRYGHKVRSYLYLFYLECKSTPDNLRDMWGEEITCEEDVYILMLSVWRRESLWTRQVHIYNNTSTSRVNLPLITSEICGGGHNM